MDMRLALTIAPVCVSLLFVSPSYSQTTDSIPGDLTPTSQWGSGWLVLTSTTDFKKGEVIKLKMGKTADKVVVRLLPNGKSPDRPTGVVTGCIDVPDNGVVEVLLQRDHPLVEQISVHGGPNPWGKYSCGGGNGPATLVDVQRVRR